MRVYNLGFRVDSVGLRNLSLRCLVLSLGFMVSCLGFRIRESQFEVWDLGVRFRIELRAYGLWFKVWGVGIMS